MFDLSAKLKGLVIFIEHRYYGDSLPFGSASYQDKDHLGYLTSEQALADFAVLITEVKVHESSVEGCVNV
jgi:lysosomal Pro-X carboxypeptidase